MPREVDTKSVNTFVRNENEISDRAVPSECQLEVGTKIVIKFIRSSDEIQVRGLHCACRSKIEIKKLVGIVRRGNDLPHPKLTGEPLILRQKFDTSFSCQKMGTASMYISTPTPAYLVPITAYYYTLHFFGISDPEIQCSYGRHGPHTS